MKHTLRYTAFALALIPPTLSAQWSKDPSANLALSGSGGDVGQAKLRVAGDARAYVSWFDSDPAGSPAFGYDVRLQRLDPNGKPVWPAGGVLIADRGFSSTQDYGLDAAPNGDAWLAFRDDRFTGVQITATRVAPDGTQVFGATGVQLTNTTAFVASPKIAATASGGAVVAWTQDDSVRIRRLDSSGATVGSELTIPTGGATNSLADLHATGDDAIISWVSQTGGFFGPRHLIAQRLNASNVPQWGSGAVVFDTGSLQIGNFPSFEPDGSGGAVFAWYGVSPLQSYAQHVLADGSLAFGAGGVPVSTNGAQIRVSPSASYDAVNDETYVFWVEQNTLQSQSGLSGQKLDATGNRQWTDNGATFVPIGGNGTGNVRVSARTGSATVLWSQEPLFANATLHGLTVDAAGTPAHAIAGVATTPGPISRLAAAAGPFGDVFGAWAGEIGGVPTLLGQNLLPTGVVGPAAGSLTRTGGTNQPGYTAVVGPLGGSLSAQVDLSGSGYPLAFLFVYLAPATVPFGSQVILVDFTGPELLHLAPAAGPLAQFTLPVPNTPLFCGLRLATQAVHVDAVLDPLLTNAVDWYLGF